MTCPESLFPGLMGGRVAESLVEPRVGLVGVSPCPKAPVAVLMQLWKMV